MSATYSFCETETAGPQSAWHIRRLTHVGRKLGGGADTMSLCGVKVAWDLNAEITYHQLQSCCATCARTYITESSG